MWDSRACLHPTTKPPPSVLGDDRPSFQASPSPVIHVSRNHHHTSGVDTNPVGAWNGRCSIRVEAAIATWSRQYNAAHLSARTDLWGPGMARAASGVRLPSLVSRLPPSPYCRAEHASDHEHDSTIPLLGKACVRAEGLPESDHPPLLFWQLMNFACQPLMPCMAVMTSMAMVISVCWPPTQIMTSMGVVTCIAARGQASAGPQHRVRQRQKALHAPPQAPQTFLIGWILFFGFLSRFRLGVSQACPRACSTPNHPKL